MPILYIETNFLMSIAEGRDPDAEGLLTSTPPSFRIAMPGVCYMEGLWSLENLRKQSRVFSEMVNGRIADWRRDVTSTHSGPLIAHLVQSLTKAGDRFNDVEVRFFRALIQISKDVDVINPNAGIIVDSVGKGGFMKDLTDNLILHCIIGHANRHPNERKVLLTGDHHFGMADVEKIWKEAGIEERFTAARMFLEWLKASSGT